MPPSFTKGCHLWSSVSLRSIGVVRTPYAKRSDCPRQGRLNPQVRGVIYLHPWLNPDLVDGLRGFSHMWCIFYMHRNHRNIQGEELPARIRPPSGGDKKDSNTTGSRRNKCVLQQDVSGMQAEETDCIDVDDPSAIPNIENNFSIRIEVSNLDILDNTPVLDIKPYIPVYDSFPGATISHWLEEGLQRRSS
eukprot:TRINITY_DN8014_c0_g1_i1.p1 TRINITY_DN8014_c0_g1~~TRINITY_DN8014_c0_g1_i1.p1  ORF type:complete len:191 (+),score=22.51 TRINITY_DN8014_c0_g1_i1:105-677(+)